MKLKKLNAYELKIIAISTMFFDHAVAISLSHNSLLGMALRLPGRIVAPVMCYLIAEGYHKTSNQGKYAKRLLLFSLISHIPYNLLFSFDFFEATSVMWELFLGLLSLIIAQSKKYPITLKVCSILFCCALSIPANWNFVTVLWIVFFGIFHGNNKKQMISFISVGVFAHIVPTFINFGFMHNDIPHWYQLGIFLAIPLIGLYSGERGRTSKIMKFGFYIFYPAHLVLLFLVENIISNFIDWRLL